MTQHIASHIDLLTRTAKRQGLRTKKITKGGSFERGVYITDDTQHLFLAMAQTGFYPSTPRWFAAVADSKIISEQYLRALGLKTLTSTHVDVGHCSTHTALRQALANVRRFPVLVKPESGFKGNGFYIANTKTELFTHAKTLYARAQNFLVQQLTFGIEYRVLVVNNHVYAAHTKRFPTVIGDGKKTVDTLLKKAAYPIDENFLTNALDTHHLNRQSVPDVGVEIPYNITRKGTETLYDDQSMPPAIQKWALETVRTLGTPTCGFDVFIPDDVTKTDQYTIIEINASPGFRYLANKYKRFDIVNAIAADIISSHFETKNTL